MTNTEKEALCRAIDAVAEAIVRITGEVNTLKAHVAEMEKQIVILNETRNKENT